LDTEVDERRRWYGEPHGFLASEFRRQLTQPSGAAPAVRAYLDGHRAGLLEMFALEGEGGVGLARKYAAVMDGLLALLHAGAVARHAEQSHAPYLLGAVGGYGRQLLGWKSDLDVRFLTAGAPKTIQSLVEAMLYPLWDAGISIGHQVMTPLDAVVEAARDLPTATALLDFRPLAGHATLGQELEQAAFTSVFSAGQLPAFLARLEAEAHTRHRRYGDSVYLLEPDVKNGAGGLRDVDLALWAARARWRTSDMNELLRLEVLAPRDAQDMRLAIDFLWNVRNRLHQRAGRRSDRLTFAEQETLARDMGYRLRVGAAKGASEAHLLGAMVEAFMSDYYRHARAITRLRDQLIGRAKRRAGQRRALDLGGGLLACDGGVGLHDPGQLARDPALALRLYTTALARDMSVLARARDAIAHAASAPEFCAALRDSPEAAALFVDLACSHGAPRFPHGSILAELHDVGLLVAMIPEFAPVVGRVHHDLYHVYTVDVHSVAAVDRLRALRRGDLAKQHPLASSLAAVETRPQVLCLATLLHDVGKAIGASDHARRGAAMARPILERLGLCADDVDDACHLILKHLHMYLVAVRRDLEDPSTIAEFAREVHGREGLRHLYLLTVCDLATTGPTSMTKWKAGMLDALLHASEGLLSGRPALEHAPVSRVRAEVKQHWDAGLDPSFLDEFLDTMPERYLQSNTPAEIAAHAKVARRVPGSPVSAALVPSRHADVAQLCVVTESGPGEGLCVVTADRPGLLAAITAAIAASRLEIHAALNHSRPLPNGGAQAVDLFWIRTAEGAEGVKSALPKLERDLEQVITGRVAPRELLKRRSPSRFSERPLPFVSTEIGFDHRASAEHTIVEVSTRDRPGLLFTLSQALHELGLTIALAKVNTEGERASDVFYVTEADASKLLAGQRTQAVREGLLKALSVATTQP
jgi:[protein-PII] uridylyltransferase